MYTAVAMNYCLPTLVGVVSPKTAGGASNRGSASNRGGCFYFPNTPQGVLLIEKLRYLD